MSTCWHANPLKRPKFSEIREMIAKELDAIVSETYNYLDPAQDYYQPLHKERVRMSSRHSSHLVHTFSNTKRRRKARPQVAMSKAKNINDAYQTSLPRQRSSPPPLRSHLHSTPRPLHQWTTMSNRKAPCVMKPMHLLQVQAGKSSFYPL